MYWAYTTMTTVGYGDISSTTLAEKIWAIITMIVSGFFFSFVVGRMASIVAKLDSHRTAYNERMEVVTAFLKDTNLPRPLEKRCVRCCCLLRHCQEEASPTRARGTASAACAVQRLVALGLAGTSHLEAAADPTYLC